MSLAKIRAQIKFVQQILGFRTLGSLGNLS